MIKLAKYHKNIIGLSLVELLVTMFIASIAISGMVVAYADCIRQWRRSAEKMVLYNEGSAALSLMARQVRKSLFVTTRTTWGVPGRQMILKVYIPRIDDTRGCEFYYFPFDNSLRWNDLTGDQGIFNERLLPLSNFRYRPGETPYLQVQNATFTPIDVERPTNPSTDGFGMIKIDITLSSARGDTITMSEVVAKRNKSD
jgi:hypothetical protein